MRRVAAAIRSTEPGFPVLLPTLPALISVLLAQSSMYLMITLTFPPGLDARSDGLYGDVLLGLAVAIVGVVWAWCCGRRRVSGWTGTGLTVACYGLFARVALHATVLMLPAGSDPAEHPDFGPILRTTETIGAVAVVLGLLLVGSACRIDLRERRTPSAVSRRWIEVF